MKIAHITIQTDRFEEEINFYEKYTGLKIIERICPAGKNIVFMGESEDGPYIEIIDNPEAANAGNKNLSIGFRGREDINVREVLIADGYKVSPVIKPVPDVSFFFTEDPAGVMVQFI